MNALAQAPVPACPAALRTVRTRCAMRHGRMAWCAAMVASAAVLLTGCAPLPPQDHALAVGRASLVLPAGPWVALEVSNEALPLWPDPVSTVPLQTRVVGLRGADQQWLALLWVQTNNSNSPRPTTLWTGTRCPQQRGTLVEDVAQGSPVRIDCLRFKRWAASNQWLDKNEPLLVQWLAHHQVEVPGAPYSHLNYRYATLGGAYVQVQALVDQRLLTPDTRNSEEFLRSGQPAYAWIHQVAQAARQSTADLNGVFPVPSFPIDTPY